jgi:hypothetical protein
VQLSNFHKKAVDTGTVAAMSCSCVRTQLSKSIGLAIRLHTFSVPFALLLWRGRTTLDERRWLNLGRLGYVVDWIGLIWMAWVCVWTSFPLYIPVTATSMNYASAVFGVVVCISAVFYVFSYRHGLNRFEPRPRSRFS